MAGEDRVLAGGAKHIDFQTDPSRYRHWKLDVEGDVATLTMDVDENGGLFEGYQLKLNSYDLGVDIELADALERHLASRQRPKIVISDERDTLMGTGGGIAKALPQLGNAPFFLVNSDTFWLDGVKPNFVRLADAFDAATMDALLLLASATGSVGYEGRGDFAMAPDGRLQRRGEREVVPFVYAGAAILAPALFADAPSGAFPLTRLFDRAGDNGRLFGLRLEGVWMHVGTPDAVTAAEAVLAGAH